MADQRFKLVFYGKIAEGHDIEVVKNNLKALLKTDEKTIERIFCAESTAIKSNLDYESAVRYKSAFEKTGAMCSIEPVEDVTRHGGGGKDEAVSTESPEHSSAPLTNLKITAADLISKKRFLSKLEALDNALKQIVAQIIPDPLVLLTKWMPVNRAGTNFCSHRLEETSAGKYEFRPTGILKGFASCLMLVGIANAVYIPVSELQKRDPDGKAAIGVLVSLLMAAAGAYFRFRGVGTFDLTSGHFFKGRRKPIGAAAMGEPTKVARIADIHALQLVPIFHPKSTDSDGGVTREYYSFELNLVLRDGKRISVVNHADRETLEHDAATLAGVMRKPVWNVIDPSIKFYNSIGVVR